VRDGSWKLVAQKNGDSNSIELFNLEKDPRESIDLASEHPQILERLWSLYQEWEQRTRANRRGQPVN
jgi:arylsulfatase